MTVSSDSLRTYLNDHLAGATLGGELARHLQQRYEGEPFGPTMARIAVEVEEDCDALKALIERLDVSRNPVKEASAWVAEKAGRAKFAAAGPGEDDLGAFQALETMALGVAGKRALWIVLRSVASEWPQIATLDLTGLIERADDQFAALEAERLDVGARVLADSAGRS